MERTALSRARKAKTNRCCWISARCGATGATSSTAKATKIAEIAKIINEHFVPVKVDRDERPDVDSRYQSAISAISGQGGWPLTGFLMPDGRPFYGGTYFPPVDQQGRPSFRRVLLAVADAYKNKRDELLKTADALAEAVAKAEDVQRRARGV